MTEVYHKMQYNAKHATRYHKTWYIPERAHMSHTNLHYYQSMIAIIEAVLLIHVFGMKSKSHPGVQYDVSHLCVYTQTDVGHGWQIISLQRAFTSHIWVEWQYFCYQRLLMTSLSGSDAIHNLLCVCECVCVCICVKPTVRVYQDMLFGFEGTSVAGTV